MRNQSNRNTFRDQQINNQIKWRKNNISTAEQVLLNGEMRKHIIPDEFWKENLWEGIREDMAPYLDANNIKHHPLRNNLISSWALCANLYFVVRKILFRQLMTAFLTRKLCKEISEITGVELEFAFDEYHPQNPRRLLGERQGSRGINQTTPDVAFFVTMKTGSKGLFLVEVKYTEYHFYNCSGRKRTDKGIRQKPPNPDPSRCMYSAKFRDYSEICHQKHVWGRKYWNYLELSDAGRNMLRKCPASIAGYQLFRQQALAEAVAGRGEYNPVVSGVAYDERNIRLMDCMKSAGLPDFTKSWERIWKGKTEFMTWTHQEWVEYVRSNSSDETALEWAEYVKDRYGY